MTNMLIRNRRGRLLAAGLRATIVVGVLTVACAGDNETDQPTSKPLRYITEQEMLAFVELIEKASPDETVPREPSSAREKARSYRGHWAFGAVKLRQDSRYRLVPPKLGEAEDRTLAKWIAELETPSDSRLDYAVDTLSIYQIESEALHQLFPDWTFVLVPYAVHAPPPVLPRDSGGLDYPFWRILALRATAVRTFSEGNIYTFPRDCKKTTGFLAFLQSEGIRIRSDEDASRFWDARCSFHRSPWSSGKHTRVDDTLWRLNDRPTQPGEPSLEVGTDPEGNILWLKRITPDTTKEPQEEK